MYIPPNSKIYVLRNVPLDPTQSHTIGWDKFSTGLAAQTNYFMSKAKYTFTEQTYQRTNKYIVRLNVLADNLFDCNYLMFQNTSFGSKWFYAFIKKINYINNNVTEIEYIIDDLQTWWFDFEFEDCFIEREHTTTDEIGDNLIPENLELGEYVIESTQFLNTPADMTIVVAATFDQNYDNYGGSNYSGLFSALYYHQFPDTPSGRSAAASFILGAATEGKNDGIVSVFYAPTHFISTGTPPSEPVQIQKIFPPFDDYIPKNNKLFTFPYNFLVVSNLQGEAHLYRYEFFGGASANFLMTGDFTSNPSVLLFPQSYKGMAINYDERISLSGYPQIAFATDSYKAWLAQTAAGLPYTLQSQAISGLATGINAGLIAGALPGAGAALSPALAAVNIVAGAATTISNLLAEKEKHSILPYASHGKTSSTTMAAVGLLCFSATNMRITKEFAKIIDNYFNLYGYASHRVGKPILNARPHWVYTKTVGCQIIGSIPADSAITITAIFDNGITVWRNPSEVGNYALDNRPIVITPGG